MKKEGGRQNRRYTLPIRIRKKKWKKLYEMLDRENNYLSSVALSLIWFRRYIKTEILQIRHKTLFNQSINQSINQSVLILFISLSPATGVRTWTRCTASGRSTRSGTNWTNMTTTTYTKCEYITDNGSKSKGRGGGANSIKSFSLFPLFSAYI